MENFDILNEDGEPLGIVKSRDETHRKGLWHKTVHIWILNSKDELLIQKRASSKESHPDLWDISCAGHIEAGTTPEEAAQRECREELGIDVDAGDFTCIFTVRQQYRLNKNTFLDNEFCNVFLLRKDLLLAALKLHDKEVAAVKWIHWRALEKRCSSRDFVEHPDEYRELFKLLAGRAR